MHVSGLSAVGSTTARHHRRAVGGIGLESRLEIGPEVATEIGTEIGLGAGLSACRAVRTAVSLWLLLVAAAAPGELAAQDACPAGAVVNAETGAERAGICAVLAEAEASNTDALVLLHHGDVIAEWHSERHPGPVHVMSVTKSVAGLAVGRLILEGKVEGVEQPLADFFPEWRQGRKASITIEHLLTHTTGLQDIQNAGIEIEPSPDALRLALAAELSSDPGAEFGYNNKATNLLSGLVQAAAGMDLDEYLAATVFRDLGIVDVEWINDPAGNAYGMAGLIIGAADLGRVGAMMAAGGVWDGAPVVDPAFAAAAVSTRHTLYPRHGYLWWLLDPESEGPSGFYGDGWLGQWLVVVPETGVVGVRLIDRGSWRDSEDGYGGFREAVRGLTIGGG